MSSHIQLPFCIATKEVTFRVSSNNVVVLEINFGATKSAYGVL